MLICEVIQDSVWLIGWSVLLVLNASLGRTLIWCPSAIILDDVGPGPVYVKENIWKTFRWLVNDGENLCASGEQRLVSRNFSQPVRASNTNADVRLMPASHTPFYTMRSLNSWWLFLNPKPITRDTRAISPKELTTAVTLPHPEFEILRNAARGYYAQNESPTPESVSSPGSECFFWIQIYIILNRHNLRSNFSNFSLLHLILDKNRTDLEQTYIDLEQTCFISAIRWNLRTLKLFL